VLQRTETILPLWDCQGNDGYGDAAVSDLSASSKKINSLFGGRIVFLASLGLAAGLVILPLATEAAHAAPLERLAAKTMNQKPTEVAAKDVEETGAIQTNAPDTSTCDRSRKRLFVEGEGWIVRKVTTCY
jgi:hypothetical protein